MQTFGERLKRLRAMKNVTQEQAAVDLGLSVRGIQNYEGGIRKPTYDALAAIASYFGVPADYFLGIGIFKDWDTVISKKEDIIQFLCSHNPAFASLQLERWTEPNLMKFFDALFDNIIIDGNTINYSPKIPLEDLQTMKFQPPNNS